MLDSVQTSDGRLRVWDTFRDVTPGELFSYWIEPEKLKTWWPNEVTVDPVPGGRYCYEFAAGHILTGTFSDVEPGRRLAFSWRWEHETDREQRVVVDFERRDADTLLTVTQGPYTVGKAGRERQAQLDDWTHLLGRLKTAVRRT